MVASQVLHPTRAAIRTSFQSLIAFCTIFPLIVETAGLSQVAGVAGALVFAGVVARVMTLPQVNAFIAVYVPWLAATPASETFEPASNQAVSTDWPDTDDDTEVPDDDTDKGLLAAPPVGWVRDDVDWSGHDPSADPETFRTQQVAILP